LGCFLGRVPVAGRIGLRRPRHVGWRNSQPSPKPGEGEKAHNGRRVVGPFLSWEPVCRHRCLGAGRYLDSFFSSVVRVGKGKFSSAGGGQKNVSNGRSSTVVPRRYRAKDGSGNARGPGAGGGQETQMRGVLRQVTRRRFGVSRNGRARYVPASGTEKAPFFARERRLSTEDVCGCLGQEAVSVASRPDKSGKFLDQAGHVGAG